VAVNPAARCIAWVTGLALLASAAVALAARVDPDRSRVGFELGTRWGQSLQGRFKAVAGEVETLPDGRRRVRLRLDTRGVEIAGHPGYTRFARGSGFFDVERWPAVDFVSDPYDSSLVRQGGSLGGTLTIRGISHHQFFLVAPGGCERPGLDCDVVARGVIDRGDYGMGRWRIAVRDEVTFHLQLRLREGAA
jgi:polyisoprenoid-binding protein YceI